MLSRLQRRSRIHLGCRTNRFVFHLSEYCFNVQQNHQPSWPGFKNDREAELDDGPVIGLALQQVGHHSRVRHWEKYCEAPLHW